jgi:hypothetical protein
MTVRSNCLLGDTLRVRNCEDKACLLITDEPHVEVWLAGCQPRQPDRVVNVLSSLRVGVLSHSAKFLDKNRSLTSVEHGITKLIDEPKTTSRRQNSAPKKSREQPLRILALLDGLAIHIFENNVDAQDRVA